MKLTFKENAKLFWDRNKVDILCWLAGAGLITGMGCAAVHMNRKAEEKHKAALAEKEQKRAEARARFEEEEERIKNDPANQIAGGYVRPENDGLADFVYPTILVNTVPVANMGELGQEVVQRLNEEWFGEFGETGVENPFDPATATVDVVIDFGHEVWKRNNPEEETEESQEKQAS